MGEVEAGVVKQGRVADLIAEGNEILSIIVATIRTARRGRGSPDHP